MVVSLLCHLRRVFPRLSWTLFVVCVFVVLSGFGILTWLPDGSTSGHTVAVRASSRHVIESVLSREPEPVDQDPETDQNFQFAAPFNESEEWKQANPSWKEYKLLVYSAYWDDRTKPACVRIIGTTLTKKSPSVMCRVSLKNGKSVDITAHKKPVNEHWNLKYSAFLFSCCSNELASSVPLSVSVFEESVTNESARLAVRRNRKDGSRRKRVALCVKPFHYNFDRSVWLIEFVEFYRMMGVDYFLFYNESVGDDVEKTLRFYEESGTVTVLPWRMLVENQKEIRTQNMFAALNDCNYRLMHLFDYVVSVDIDEFVVPKSHRTLREMLVSFSTGKQEQSCAPSYVFQNAFFYLYWENDTSLFGEEPEASPGYVPYLLSQYKTRRLRDPHKHGKRSKYISRPEMVLETGNHLTWRHTGSCRPYKVPSDVALLHHYRICEFGGFECLKLPSVQDRAAHKYGLELLNRVSKTCEKVFGRRCPRSPPLGSPW